MLNKLDSDKIIKYLYFLPITIWMTIFFVIPTLIIMYFSFLKKGLYGGVLNYHEFTLKSYIDIFKTPSLLEIFLKTINISLWITIIVLLVAIPTAYYIARSKYKNIYLILIIVPFWTNFMVRIFSIISILGNNGLVNKFITKILKMNELQLLYNKTAVIIISVYVFLPYAILPLYSSIEKFDFSLIDAARDLGANKYQALIKVFLPGIKSGIITAFILTFIPAIGSYAVPDVVGGTDGNMIGNIIANKMFTLRDWPSASAMATIFIIVTILCIVFNMKLGGRKND